MRKLTLDEFVNRSQIVHKNKYNYNLVDYKNTSTKVTIVCNDHGEFYQSPSKHLRGQGCKQCGRIKMQQKQSLNLDQIIQKFKNVHKNKYYYNKVIYTNLLTKVKIMCKKHGVFKQTPNNHLQGQGCPKCKGNKLRESKKMSLFTLKEKIYQVHKQRYIYDFNDLKYDNNNFIIKIKCRNHGYFNQSINNHLSGQNCPKCSNISKKRKLTLKQNKVIQQFIKTHNIKYNYNSVSYKGDSYKIKIYCKYHKYFYQTPSNHKRGKGCPKCFNRISKPEIQWLNSLNIKEKNRQISLPGLPKSWKVDGYDPETNTVYEFLGGFWHGDPVLFHSNNLNKKAKKTFGELYNKTINKEIKIRKVGYNYQFIWEKDWKSL